MRTQTKGACAREQFGTSADSSGQSSRGLPTETCLQKNSLLLLIKLNFKVHKTGKDKAKMLFNKENEVKTGTRQENTQSMTVKDDMGNVEHEPQEAEHVQVQG